MGCDIHIIAEVKKNGKWKRNTDKVFKNPYFDMYDKIRKEDPERYEELKKSKWANLDEFQEDPSDGRNYDWFAILADVRNGRGFAGVSTGEGFNVIAMPKGLPEDLSEEGMKYFCTPIAPTPELEHDEDENGVYYTSESDATRYVNDYGCEFVTIDGQKYVTDPDYHSTSYLSLEEFDNFDWNQLTMKYGIITLEQYKELKDSAESPDGWSGGISGPDIAVVSQEVADAILQYPEVPITVTNGFMSNTAKVDVDNGKPASDYKIYVQYEWPVQYREWFKWNIESVVEPMRKQMEVYDDVRIVFSFDN